MDDEPQIAQIARDYLEHAGFSVIVAGDGRKALDLARSRQPDLSSSIWRCRSSTDWTWRASCDASRTCRSSCVTARVEEADRLARAGGRRRRLRHQAVQPARAGRAGEGGAAARRRLRLAGRRLHGGDLAFDVPRVRLARRSQRSISPPPSSSCWRRWHGNPDACSRGPSCSTPPRP